MTQLTPDQLRAQVDRLPRVSLAHLPTPLEETPRFAKSLGGPRIHVKRDDCTGLAFGGNKARHNEFLLAVALRRGCDLFVWGAGVQSNNCRQTAACCAKAGLECHLVLTKGGKGNGPVPIQGNLLLDHLLGASYEIVDVPMGEPLIARIAERAEQFRQQGRNVFFWDESVVKPRAAVSYVLCLIEILEQSSREGWTPSAVYVSSAGSTGSGLALAASALGVPFPVFNICPIRWEWDTQEDMADVANQTAALLDLDTRLTPADVRVSFDFIAPGYGKLSPDGAAALELLARTEGILLDPIYSGKAAAGMIHDIRRGRYRPDEHIVLIHTGGTPALFAYSNDLTAAIDPKRLLASRSD